MKRRAARRIMACILALLLTGCSNSPVDAEVSKEETVSSVLPENAGADILIPLETRTKEDEPLTEERIWTEDEIDLSAEDCQSTETVTDIPPVDTVEYVESDREEITETIRTKSVVNENDPSTYQIVLKEEEVQTPEEIPEEYTDKSGNVKYEYIDGIWYEYRYSTGDITMTDKEDEETALQLLNLFGEYDEFQVIKIECSELAKSETETEYAYHVLYRKALAMESAPTKLEGLTVTRTRQEMKTEKKTVEVKVPVELKKESGTGRYIYYGWQELDGDTFYFDKNGEKVTGEQIIKGLRYLFDEDGKLLERSGVNVSSRNGAIDWEKAGTSGIDFALVRCGYRGASGGMMVADSRCAENIEGAQKAGMETGIYFYSQAVSKEEARQEADFLVETAEKYKISEPLILAIGNTRAYNGRAEGLSPHDRTAYVQIFCETVREAGYVPMIYGNESWLAQCLDMPALEGVSFWLAQCDPNTAYTGAYSIWQYTEKGTVNGIDGCVGLNMKRKK